MFGSSGQSVKAFLAGVVFLAAVAAAAAYGHLPFAVLWVYLGMSVITVIFYAFDKFAAKQGAWRTPEATLHLLSLCCGWPGAMYAQQLLRHKTVKASFRVGFWFTVVLNVGGLFYFFVKQGKL